MKIDKDTICWSSCLKHRDLTLVLKSELIAVTSPVSQLVDGHVVLNIRLPSWYKSQLVLVDNSWAVLVGRPVSFTKDDIFKFAKQIDVFRKEWLRKDFGNNVKVRSAEKVYYVAKRIGVEKYAAFSPLVEISLISQNSQTHAPVLMEAVSNNLDRFWKQSGFHRSR